jgi:hypothetical protein
MRVSKAAVALAVGILALTAVAPHTSVSAQATRAEGRDRVPGEILAPAAAPGPMRTGRAGAPVWRRSRAQAFSESA